MSVSHTNTACQVPLADGEDNFEAFKSVDDWQIHVYGDVSQPLRDGAASASLSLHEFAWSDNATKAGLMRDPLYLIRPDGSVIRSDGYVAVVETEQDITLLENFRLRFNLAMQQTRQEPTT